MEIIDEPYVCQSYIDHKCNTQKLLYTLRNDLAEFYNSHFVISQYTILKDISKRNMLRFTSENKYWWHVLYD